MAPLPSPTKKWHTTSYQSISPSRPELSLSGKVVLITGGGTGIGARTARSYAEAGASHIAILGRRQAKLEETASEIRAAYPGTQIHTYVADMTDASAINKVFAEFTTAAKGKIDILISNAATGLAGISIATVSPDAWFSDIETNVKGPLHLTQAFLSGYGKKDGLIINITSGMSFLFGATTSSYAVSKEAGVRFFQIVGMENPELRIVHVQPGIVETDLNRKGSIPAQDDSEFYSAFHRLDLLEYLY
jgi:NAD(P)-dependent dehydrogenase (short-subunit alcohol dehydrogenase family)